MLEKNIVQRTRDILRNDRLELMRAYADDQEKYCFFASLYEVAYHLHGNKMPPRFKQAEAEWLSFGLEDDKVAGGVNQKELINLIVRLANQLEIKVENIYISSSVFSLFVADKAKEAHEAQPVPVEKRPKPKKRTYRSHAESQTGLPRSQARMEVVLERGWEVVMAVTFSDHKTDHPVNSLDTIHIEEVAKTEADETMELDFPYLTVLVKESTEY